MGGAAQDHLLQADTACRYPEITLLSTPRPDAHAPIQGPGCAGGANIPAVNELLAPFGVAFGDAVLEGPLQLLGEKLHYASGTNIVKFPAGGTLHAAALADKAVAGGNWRDLGSCDLPRHLMQGWGP